LLGQLPGDSVLSKFSSEAALNVGDASYALRTVRPLAQANPNDWHAVALLTRACAESGDTACRDSGITNMLDLHRRGVVPRQVQQYLVERVKSGENTLVIRTSLEPWGYYQVYDLGQVMDREGKIFLRITIESSDGDQALFAKENPKEGAAGHRRFSLDAYRETGLNSNGKRTQAKLRHLKVRTTITAASALNTLLVSEFGSRSDSQLLLDVVISIHDAEQQSRSNRNPDGDIQSLPPPLMNRNRGSHAGRHHSPHAAQRVHECGEGGGAGGRQIDAGCPEIRSREHIEARR